MKNYMDDFWLVLGDGRRALPVLVIMMLALATLDLAGLGLIAPLIVTMTGGGGAHSALFPAPLLRLASMDLRTIAVLVLLVFTGKMIAGYFIQRALARFSEMQRSRLMTRLLAAYLDKPYEEFLKRNSAELVSSIVTTTWMFSTGMLAPVLRLLADGVMFVAIVGFLLWMNWLVVGLLGALLLAAVMAYMRIVRTRLAEAGQLVNESSARTVQDVNHGVGGLREIRILGVEQHCIDELHKHSLDLARGNALYAALSAVPRYLMEWTLVIGLVTVALFLSMRQFPANALVPLMGMIAVAAIRLMPGVTSIIGSLNSIRMNRYGLKQMADDLRGLDATNGWQSSRSQRARPTPFQSLTLESVTFVYAGSNRPAIEDVSLKISAGQAVGFIGRSGSGKSTAADVLLGLLQPQQGRVLVNGDDIRKDLRAWMQRVAYIPQQIYLADDSLARNIALGVDPKDIDSERLLSAVRTARLDEVIARLPDGLATVIGERGVRLSGGQRQRVALARAFYHDRDVIVMDEATSALDDETEREVVAAIRELHGKKTLIIIAHRVTTLEGCEPILRFEHGRVRHAGSYAAVRSGGGF